MKGSMAISVGFAVIVGCGAGANLVCHAADFQDVGLYQSVDEMFAWADHLGTANPDIVRVVEFGRSHQDRPLIALQIGVTPGYNNPAKPEFLFTGGLHAQEVIGSEAAYRLAEHLVSGYRNGDPVFREILAEREVWIVPNLNPDGRVRVEEGYGRQRKNMELFPLQAANDYTRGVDLNRNFPHRWSDALVDPRWITYRGPDILSTPEASALWSLLHDEEQFSDLLGALDFHSGMEGFLSPWLSIHDFEENPLPEADRAKFDFLVGQMSQRTGLTADRPRFDFFGTMADSLYEEFGTYAMIEELYVATSPDAFTSYNPLDQATIDDRMGRAIDASMFLLSDEAFLIVPEPGSMSLVVLGLLGLVCCIVCRGRRHIA